MIKQKLKYKRNIVQKLKIQEKKIKLKINYKKI